jgi:Fe-S oxidoreductase
VLSVDKELNGGKQVVYHDSCYLGRYNDLYDTPRNIIRDIPGVKLVEAERQKRTSFCCGAGGGHMWMKETTGKEIKTERFNELYGTGAKKIVTACPYCMIMLDDAVKEKELEEEIKVMDLAQMLLKSIEG